MAKRIYNQTSLFGALYAYLVVISPPIYIREQIKQLKLKLNEISPIGDKNLKSIAHVTLTDNLTDDVDLGENVKKLIGSQEPFIVKVSGWDYFDHGHSVTLYLKVLEPQPIINIAKLLKSLAKTPHIPLARRIDYSTFSKLKPWLDTTNFTAEWLCTEVTVLRKLMSEKHLGFRERFTIPFE